MTIKQLNLELVNCFDVCLLLFLFSVNKQLDDKERVAAALENNHLLTVVNKCIADTDPEPLGTLLK